MRSQTHARGRPLTMYDQRQRSFYFSPMMAYVSGRIPGMNIDGDVDVIGVALGVGSLHG